MASRAAYALRFPVQTFGPAAETSGCQGLQMTASGPQVAIRLTTLPLARPMATNWWSLSHHPSR